MEVKSRAEAWKIASEIFTTDYKKDETKSERAGYDIYVSTANNNNSWISDLGARLEINLETGKTVNIWIAEVPQRKSGKSRKINLEELAKEINRNECTRKTAWTFYSLEKKETKDTIYGVLIKYEVIIKFKASKYDINAYRYEVCYYEDADSYAVYWNGSEYIG